MSKLPPVDRRNFVRLMLAGGAGSMAGCVREQPQKIVSPIDRPEEMIPGKVLDYATVCRACPAGCGLTVRTREARASKLEGIAEHPVNDGALCARGHAELQRLYSPQRLHEPLARNDSGDLAPIGWGEALNRVAEALAASTGEGDSASQGGTAVPSRGLGPTVRTLLGNFTEALGGSLLEYEPYPFVAMRTASRIAFGQPAQWRPRIEKARVVLSLGADFLETWLSPVAQARGYAEAKRYEDGTVGLHYQVEPRLSLTGANADEWFAIRPGTEHVFAMGLLRVILQENLEAGLDTSTRQALVRLAAPYTSGRVEEITDVPEAQVVHLARTFALTRPALALPPGMTSSGQATTAAHLATLLLNLAVGGLGETLELVRSALLEALSSPAELQQLRERMSDGAISVLFLHDTNPLLTLPGFDDWSQALAAVPLVVAFASTLDETAAVADLVLPISPPIESWDDWEPYAGVLGLQQPATRPLQGTRQAGDLFVQLAAQIGGAVASSIPWSSFTDLLRDRWSEVHGAAAPLEPFERFWRQTLQRGGVWGDADTTAPTPSEGLLAGAWLPPPPGEPPGATEGLELVLVPSLHHDDGGREPNGWLQEVADPMSPGA